MLAPACANGQQNGVGCGAQHTEGALRFLLVGGVECAKPRRRSFETTIITTTIVLLPVSHNN